MQHKKQELNKYVQNISTKTTYKKSISISTYRWFFMSAPMKYRPLKFTIILCCPQIIKQTLYDGVLIENIFLLTMLLACCNQRVFITTQFTVAINKQ